MSGPNRRQLVGLLAASALFPEAAFAQKDERPCRPHAYDPWVARRERKWPEKVGNNGFVNYYGEAFQFDAAVSVPRDSVPTCEVWGAEATTLDDGGPVRDHLYDLHVRGLASSTGCFTWPEGDAATFESRVNELVGNLKAACPNPAKPAPVRFVAVGSHHSSSDVYKRADATPTTVIRIDGLNQILLDRPEWKDDHPTVALVGAGITVCHLNEALWSIGLALETQGSFDGQTLAGAISTGTHGSGAQHGAIADSVEAVLIATCTKDPDTGEARWEVLQVEPDPDQAVTDASRWPADRGWRLVQDSTLFEALLVPLGTMGVIVGYVMRVRNAYFLRELRLGRPWSEVKRNLAERATIAATGFQQEGWRYEVGVSPNPVDAGGQQDWICGEVYRDPWTWDLDYLSSSREIPDKWAGNITRTVNLGGQLGQAVTSISARALTRGPRVGSFADRCYRVLKLGQGEYTQAWGAEMMVPAEHAAALVDWILERNPTLGALERGKRRNERLLNPFGVRFVRGRRGFLSPTRWWKDGQPGLVCTLEISEAVKDNDTRNLGVRDNGKPSAKRVLEAWAEAFTAEFGAQGRLHWGQLQGAYTPHHMAASYPAEDLDRWYAAFRAMNPFGLFDTAAANRLGFVARRDSDGSAHPRYRGLGS